MPQIEVKFDIDRNGIVHVSAKDLGTGKEQSITITSSGNLSEDDIKRAVKEAEQFAEEDKKKKEEAETLNKADNTLYQTEKTLKEMDDKISSEDKARIETEMNNLKQARGTNNVADIKAAEEKLTQVSYEVFGKVYQQQAQQSQQAGAQPDSGATASNDGTVETDYQVHDDK